MRPIELVPPLLDIRDLRTHFATRRGIVKAVDGVSLTVGRGETVCLVGESGSGKSVLAASITQLIPRPPGFFAGGEVLFGGENLLGKSEQAMGAIRGNRIAMIFQEPMSALNPVYTVGEQIAEVICRHRGTTRRDAMIQAAAMLDRVGIADARRRLHDYPHHLSGGMRQRVVIAISLACQPDLLIADEPTTALDVTTQAQILELIRHFQAEDGLALLLVTHDLGVAADMADRILVMYAGQVVEEGPAAKVLTGPKAPYTRGLLASVPGGSDGHRLLAIPGMVPDPQQMPSGCSFAPRCAMADGACQVSMPALEDIGEGRRVRCKYWRRQDAKTIVAPRVLAGNEPPSLPAARSDRHVLVEVASLEKQYVSGRGWFSRSSHAIPAVRGVSFEIRRGEVLGLVGESGSGKTTTGRAILRLIEPSAGMVKFDGVELTSLSAAALREYRRRMQIVFQDPYDSLNARMTVAQTVGEGMTIHGLASGRLLRDRVAELLQRVGLSPDRMNDHPHAFSGGQRQRIGIARALATGPDFIVADEPISALDLSIQAQIINLLCELKEELNLTMLFITHNLAVMDYIADRVMVMYLGRVVEIAPVSELRTNPAHPYTEALIAAIPAPPSAPRRARRALTGDIPSPQHPHAGCVFRARCPIASTICAEQMPELRAIGPGHAVACHFASASRFSTPHNSHPEGILV